MKYRKGFVTNSSSSSFIVGYNNWDDLMKEIMQHIQASDIHFNHEELENIRQQLKNGRVKKVDFKKQKEDWIERLFFDYDSTRIVYNGKALKDYSFHEVKDKNTGVGKFWYSIRKAMIEEVYVKASLYRHILVVRFSDHTRDGSIMEYTIMPELSTLLLKRSNH